MLEEVWDLSGEGFEQFIEEFGFFFLGIWELLKFFEQESNSFVMIGSVVWSGKGLCGFQGEVRGGVVVLGSGFVESGEFLEFFFLGVVLGGRVGIVGV